jgi:hypothetical protein
VKVPFTWKVTGWFMSEVDAKGYMALRKWVTQFYEVPV